jgi:hypothetical protein
VVREQRRDEKRKKGGEKREQEREVKRREKGEN